MSIPITPLERPLVGLGAMRLSTERDRSEPAAVAVLHAALDAGITFFDTANAYCWDSTETGHNERLLARALATWTGDRSRIVVATKGGLTRPEGHWIEDGRARSLVSACQASRRALGVERIQLYQLHAPDPRTPLSTSVRALAALQRDGWIERDRVVQRQRGADPGGAADRRDSCGAGRAERLARRRPSERRRPVLPRPRHPG